MITEMVTSYITSDSVSHLTEKSKAAESGKSSKMTGGMNIFAGLMGGGGA